MRAQLMNSTEGGGNELRQLEVPLNPRAILPHLEAVYRGVLTSGPGRGALRCHILDVKYEPSRRCTILYQVGGRLVLGTLNWSVPLQPAADSACAIEPLGMQAHLFPHDPALPGLASAFDPERMKQILSTALPSCRAGEQRVLRSRVTLLRYRPTRRCTLRFDLSLIDRRTGAIVPDVLYGKLYHDLAKASSVYTDMRMLYGAPALRNRGVVVARPAGFVTELGLVLQQPLVGSPLEPVLEHCTNGGSFGISPAAGAVIRVAEALASLHGAKLQAARDRPIASALGRMAQRASGIGLVDRRLGTRMGDLAEALLAQTKRLDELGGRIGFVHGDCKPSQFLVGSHVGLLDFDHAGMADPASDVGDFTATLRQLSAREVVKARGSRVSRSDTALRVLEKRFLTAYCERSGSDRGLPDRVGWYQALALLRKAIRGFQRSPLSPLPAMLVDEAWRCLETRSGARRVPVLPSTLEQEGGRS